MQAMRSPLEFFCRSDAPSVNSLVAQTGMVVQNSSPWKRLLVAATALLAAGCASTPGVTLPPNTLLLGEVMHVLTQEMVNAGEIAPGQKHENLRQMLKARGFTDAQIGQGRVVVMRDLIYWNNTVSGNKYSQNVPQLVAEGVKVEPGNIVEFRIQEVGGVIERVRARSLAEGGCYYGDVPVGGAVEVMGALSLVGPRGSASLYCAGIEKEGWERPRTYWHKPPVAGAPTASLPPRPVSLEPTPEVAVNADGLAVLLFYLNDTSFIFFSDLPIWVDGEKAAELREGTCEIVLVPAGDHVVVAGAEKGALAAVGFWEFSRRELSISVGAGERLALEYRIDDDALREGSSLPGMFQREKWDPRAFRFTQRPATSGDTCAIRGTPKVLSNKAVARSVD